ncbi:probable tubulin polyglutamylase TTLL9 isoform X3 [Pan paniscus]|uniref:probable tubulin polyglutamylase TTLL9 isoform X3 n=1 Tax=Pan paniscus TaxID=9597 RepID=UPI0006C974BA|nr:probable tubulin polyglutamylase TTLL9 isoform X3 [Pan paniscus]XP_054961021.1 probable tubulin polyglutamylase TTLL9 isoform X3 [Pan paniscus]
MDIFGGGLFLLITIYYHQNQNYKGHGLSKGKEREQRASIRFKTTLMNTLMDVLRHRPGWVEVKDEGEWDFYWCDVSWLRENFDHTYMDEHVRISHFRNHYELTRKNYMVKNLKRFRKQLEREAGKLEAAKCDFFPKTFEMPCEYHLFVEEFRKNPGITWIMKPVARSQGKGIFLFRRLKDIMDWRKDTRSSDDQKDDIPVENYVAQRYIENPYLIGGRKFDLRVYVLVMSYIPLRAWLYRDGFARFSNTRFTLNSIDDQYVHLTNVAVQKTSPDYHPKKGCKWMLQRFRQYLASKHGPEAVETLFRDIDNIFVKSLQSVQKVIISDKHCFELYGYDILIDQDLKPWLLEVNASPSLTASSQEDYELKTCLLEDTLHVVDMEARLCQRSEETTEAALLLPSSSEESFQLIPSCQEEISLSRCHPGLPATPRSQHSTSQHSPPHLQPGTSFAGLAAAAYYLNWAPWIPPAHPQASLHQETANHWDWGRFNLDKLTWRLGPKRTNTASSATPKRSYLINEHRPYLESLGTRPGSGDTVGCSQVLLALTLGCLPSQC